MKLNAHQFDGLTVVKCVQNVKLIGHKRNIPQDCHPIQAGDKATMSLWLRLWLVAILGDFGNDDNGKWGNNFQSGEK